jgi:hypothetical protein
MLVILAEFEFRKITEQTEDTVADEFAEQVVVVGTRIEQCAVVD